MSKYIILLFFLSLSACKTETLQTVLKEGSKALLQDVGDQRPSRIEIGRGLKEALFLSIEKGARQLSKKGGYFNNQVLKILLPPEVQEIQKTLKKVGLGDLSDELTVRLNRAAEDAAVKAIPIFKQAIFRMTFKDVMAVLTGGPDAATVYLKKATSSQILNAFRPEIHTSLNKVGAVSLWRDIFQRYNKLPFVKRVNPDLVGYTSDRALKGLFYTVSNREKEIRASFSARTTPLLQKVFGYAERLKKAH